MVSEFCSSQCCWICWISYIGKVPVIEALPVYIYNIYIYTHITCISQILPHGPIYGIITSFLPCREQCILDKRAWTVDPMLAEWTQTFPGRQNIYFHCWDHYPTKPGVILGFCWRRIRLWCPVPPLLVAPLDDPRYLHPFAIWVNKYQHDPCMFRIPLVSYIRGLTRILSS